MFKRNGINPTCYVLDRQYQNKCVIRSKLFSERLANARSLYKKDLFAHYGCVNAIEFSNDGELLISGGDDRRVLLWSILNTIHGEGSPVSMRTNHLSNIFCLDFDSKNSRIFSGGNDDQLLVHDIQTRLLVDKILHKKPIYGLHVNPQNDDIVATAGDDGRILIYDLRETSEPRSVLCLAKQKTGFHSVMYNPRNTKLLTTANAEEGIALWDCRKPKEQLIHFDSQAGAVSGISACFNSSGSRILALRRRLPPVLYNSQQEESICQFYHPNYYNSCTMKTCCFAGENDEYVLSGSDDFNLYMWSIPEDNSEWGSTHLVLEGHRSIVNQVRYNKQNNVIASSGVEKMVKFWTTLPVGDWEGSLLNEMIEPGRSVYSHEEYIRLVGVTGERISHDYSEHSILEDSRMMAFFDSLIQREIEGWESMNSSNNSDSDSDSSTQSYNKLSKLMYINSKMNEEPKKSKQNKIAQLISKKRKVLLKMAHKKSKHQRNGKVKDPDDKQVRSCKCKSTTKPNKNNSTKKSPRKELPNERKTHEPSSVRGKLKRYRTKESLRDMCDNFNSSIDTPSTSTGITSSHNNLFRVIEQDSEEDIPPNGCVENSIVPEENLVNILPTPINGTQDMFVHTLTTYSNDNSGSTRDNSVSSPSTSRQNRYRYDSAVCIDGGLDRASSSSDATSSFPRSTFNGSYPPLEINADNSDSDSDIDYVTPPKKRCTISDLDSGFATGPSSSMNSYEKNSSSHQECSDDVTSCSSDDELKYERFRKRLKKNKINNIRRRITEDSDSN